MATVPRLPADMLAAVARGMSVMVSSHDSRLRPSLMRAAGTDVSPDGRVFTVYLSRSQSRQLLQDIATTGHLAVVYNEPATHRTLQLKAGSAVVRAAGEQDRPALEHSVASLQGQFVLVGHPPEGIRKMLAYRLDDLVAVSFTPDEAFDQTPGPRAGQPFAGTAP